MKQKLIFGGAIICLIALNVQCKKNKKDNTESVPYDRSTMLTNIADRYIIPAYKNYNTEIINLKVSASNFTDAPTTINLTVLKNQWRATTLAWQDVAPLEFGPAADLSLRSQTNVFPIDTNEVIENISTGSYNLELPDNFDAKGLQALDYILFNPKYINDDSLVNYFANNNNAKNYLIDIISELELNSTAVYDNWLTYSSTFISNSTNNAQGSAVSNLINALTQHYEGFVRKGKVGIPLGVFNGFSKEPMPYHVEAPYSNYSIQLAIREMEAIKNIINGNDYTSKSNGAGLDDYMNFVEANCSSQSLSSTMNLQIDKIISNLNTISGNLKDAVITDFNAVNTTYQSMQQLVPLIKVDLTSALGVLITYQDNDGD